VQGAGYACANRAITSVVGPVTLRIPGFTNDETGRPAWRGAAGSRLRLRPLSLRRSVFSGEGEGFGVC
jgi:hypothetical protein